MTRCARSLEGDVGGCHWTEKQGERRAVDLPMRDNKQHRGSVIQKLKKQHRRLSGHKEEEGLGKAKEVGKIAKEAYKAAICPPSYDWDRGEH